MKEEQIHNGSYTLKQLAKQYNTSVKVFRSWLKKFQLEIGPRIGHFYNPKQVQIIKHHLGAPFLALFAFLANFTDALGRNLEVPSPHDDTHHGAADGSTSTDTHHSHATAHDNVHVDSGSAWQTVPILVTMLMIILSQLGLVKAADPRASARIRAACFLFQIVVLCGSFFYTGYIVGKAIF